MADVLARAIEDERRHDWSAFEKDLNSLQQQDKNDPTKLHEHALELQRNAPADASEQVKTSLKSHGFPEVDLANAPGSNAFPENSTHVNMDRLSPPIIPPSDDCGCDRETLGLGFPGFGSLTHGSSLRLKDRAFERRIETAFENAPVSGDVSAENVQKVQDLKKIIVSEEESLKKLGFSDVAIQALEKKAEEILKLIDPKDLESVLGSVNKELASSGIRLAFDPETGAVWLGRKVKDHYARDDNFKLH